MIVKTIKNFRLVFVCFLLFISARSFSQAADTTQTLTLSLQGARTYALQHNYDVRNSAKNIAIADRKMQEIIAQGLPQVSASAKLTDNLQLQQQVINFNGVPTVMKFGTQYNLGLTGEVNQLIFNGSYIVGVQTAKIYKNLSKVQHEQKEVDVLETVSESYYNVLVAYESKGILEQSLTNLKETLNETQKRFKEGFVEVTDVDQLQISVNRINTSLKSLDNQIDVAEQLLKYQLGVDFQTKIVLTDSLTNIVNGASKKVLNKPTFNLNENKAFQLANLQVQMGEKNVANEKMSFLPSLSAFGQVARTTMRDQFHFQGSPWFPSASVGLTLSVPIFSGGERFHKVQEAKLELEQYKIQEDQIKSSLELQNSVAKSNLESTYMSYLDDKANMDLSLKVYRRMQVKYEEGMSSNMDLIQAYDQFLNTQNTYISRCSDLMKAYNTYEKLMTNFDLNTKK